MGTGKSVVVWNKTLRRFERIDEPTGITGDPLLSDNGTKPIWVDSDNYGGGGGISAGSSFPGSPGSGDLYRRTDLGYSVFRYDGTRWLSTQQFEMDLGRNGDATEPATATKNAGYWSGLLETIYIETFIVGFFVASGGTALGASHKWVITLTVWDSGGSQGSAIGTVNIDSGSSAVFRALSATGVNTATLSNDTIVSSNATKTGTPGNLSYRPRIVYRLIAT